MKFRNPFKQRSIAEIFWEARCRNCGYMLEKKVGPKEGPWTHKDLDDYHIVTNPCNDPVPLGYKKETWNDYQA